MPKRNNWILDEDQIPGPGMYAPGRLGKFKSINGYDFGSDGKENDYANCVPGPGAYERKLQKSFSGNRFGNLARKTFADVND